MNYNNDNTNIHMMEKNKHFSIEERVVIGRMLKSCNRYSLNDIATVTGKTSSAVHKEIIKNGKLKAAGSRIQSKNPFSNYKNYTYSPKKAHKKYQSRFLTPKYITKFKFAIEWINKNIQYDQSMYEIMILFIESNPKIQCPSEATLYYYWHKNIIKYDTQRKPHKKRKKKNEKWLTDTNKVSIDQRPTHINNRTEFGHWEIDTVIDGDQKGGLLTFNERTTTNYYAIRIENKRGHTIFEALITLIQQIGIDNIKSITSDNGTEFSHHNRIHNLYGIKWYFCHPFCSGERGQNEHLNGELRFYYPKGTSFFNKTQTEIDKIITRINNKRRKSLGGNCSNELFKLNIN